MARGMIVKEDAKGSLSMNSQSAYSYWNLPDTHIL